MSDTIFPTFAVNAPIAPHAISDLREAVGWDRREADYTTAPAVYWATVAGQALDGTLVAWCAILSDSVYHAVLLDVIVHPAWQRRGVGRQ